MALTLVLWDIDGTLISTGPIAGVIYPVAFELLTGRAPQRMVEFNGRTELATMQELLRSHGLQPPDSDRICWAVESALRSRIGVFRDASRVLPGAAAALAALQAEPSIVQGVLTGNILSNARIKLQAFALDDLVDFDAGGYGSDDVLRSRLVRVAQDRCGMSRGQRFDVTNTVLIGDTVRDIEAARDGGARVIAVATGADSAERLRAAAPDALLGGLEDVAELVRTVFGCGERV
ncbi:MAG TPA: HAD family hydrolase [Solirubrobacteraceae bacterium]|nr:HAD family hydrolase [Solirubrobacteraceae bacterium]